MAILRYSVFPEFTAQRQTYLYIGCVGRVQCKRFPLVSAAEFVPIPLGSAQLLRQMRANSRETMFSCATTPCGA